MALESFGYIDDLVDTNPVPGDPVDQGDDHLRGIKKSLQGNVGGDVTATQLLVNNLAALIMTRIAEFPVMDLAGESAAKLMSLGYTGSSDTLTLINRVLGGQIHITGTGGGGTPHDLITCDPNTGVALLDAADTVRLLTGITGVAITGLLDLTGALLATGDVEGQNVIAGLQSIANAAAPVSANHLTRKDYVDPTIAQTITNTANIATNTSDIADNTNELAGISGNTGQQQIVVGGMQILAGLDSGGTNHVIVFDTPFSATPSVVALPNTLSGNDLYLSAVSNTGCTIVSFASNTVHWQAMGTL